MSQLLMKGSGKEVINLHHRIQMVKDIGKKCIEPLIIERLGDNESGEVLGGQADKLIAVSSHKFVDRLDHAEVQRTGIIMIGVIMPQDKPVILYFRCEEFNVLQDMLVLMIAVNVDPIKRAVGEFTAGVERKIPVDFDDAGTDFRLKPAKNRLMARLSVPGFILFIVRVIIFGVSQRPGIDQMQFCRMIGVNNGAGKITGVYADLGNRAALGKVRQKSFSGVGKYVQGGLSLQGSYGSFRRKEQRDGCSVINLTFNVKPPAVQLYKLLT